MAAITKRLLHLRLSPNPYLRCLHPYHLQHFSSSTSDPEPPSETPQPEPDPDPQSGSDKAPPSISSYFNEVKASLRREPPPQAPPRKPLSFSNRGNPPPPAPPSKAASLEEIRRNLSEFRQRSAAPPPPSAGGQNEGAYVSMQELYSRNINSENSGGDSATSGSPKLGFDAIRDSLRQLKSPAAKDRSDSGVRAIDPLSLARFKESLKLKAEPDANLGTGMFFGGSDRSPPIFDDKVGGKGAMRTEFVRLYNHQDLGRKLRSLRPEKKKGKWFSLQELNERLVKLREIEEKEREAMSGVGAVTKDLRESLVKLSMSTAQKGRKSTLQRLDVLGQLGSTPDFMSPPKEELVEKYFHPDNMSSAEKLKLELKKVRDEFKMSESDCGSARVQVAQLTTKIKHLSNVLQKKDKHSRKGLQAMVQRRKKLLKYLRRTDWDSYCLVLSKLGLRDNPDIKA